MASSKPKLAYRTDQREMSVLIYADGRGATKCTVFWRECQAGEERKREAVVARWQWPKPINTRAQAIACLIRMAELLRDQSEANS